MKKYFSLMLLFVLALPVWGQQYKNHEVSSDVKELTAYHDVIYPIWHTGWPRKDIKFLCSLVGDVEQGYKKIEKAVLPGILREKKAKWEDGVKKLGVCVDMYKVAASKNDSVSLLNAAEKLHSQYEAMVRLIRPVLKEVEEFHRVLYMVYHYYVPKDEFEKTKEAAAKLKVRVEAIDKAKLPERLKSQEESFNKIRTDLTAAVDKLNQVVKAGNNKKAIDQAVDGVHAKYQELEKIFD
ncbi:MAG: hypothetical protein M1495_14040 [Bacteroidetes bacterium]|nr:hypothetical protein [Bacteroidota bacterium]